MQVIKDTGFLKGLYKPEELISDNVKERDAKITFLQKLIDVTSEYFDTQFIGPAHPKIN